MDTPYRLKHLLGSCQQAFGASRRGFLAIDITGPAEAFWVGDLGDLTRRAEGLGSKLNFVLIVDGA
jgi:16S rRNA C1402 (ribose-2'-O) methylase RsmI